MKANTVKLMFKIYESVYAKLLLHYLLRCFMSYELARALQLFAPNSLSGDGVQCRWGIAWYYNITFGACSWQISINHYIMLWYKLRVGVDCVQSMTTKLYKHYLYNVQASKKSSSVKMEMDWNYFTVEPEMEMNSNYSTLNSLLNTLCISISRQCKWQPGVAWH